MPEQIYGYIRVSSTDQNEDRQMIALHSRQVPERNIYMDKQSGKDFNRPQYQKLLKNVIGYETEEEIRYFVETFAENYKGKIRRLY